MKEERTNKPKPLINIMVDIESGGVVPGSSIFSIGATMFDFYPELITLVGISPIFYRNASRQSNAEIGLKEDASTMKWWEEKSEAARNETLYGTQHVAQMLRDFHEWYVSIREAGNDVRMWGKGAGFEAKMLEAAYRAVGAYDVPWHYRELMDYRTLEYLFKPIVSEEVWKDLDSTHTKHTALGDAIMQARKAEAIFNVLRHEGMV